jgi:hypothetical protein
VKNVTLSVTSLLLLIISLLGYYIKKHEAHGTGMTTIDKGYTYKILARKNLNEQVEVRNFL